MASLIIWVLKDFDYNVSFLNHICSGSNVDYLVTNSKALTCFAQAWSMHETNELWHLIDPKLAHETPNTEIIEVIKIGLSCVQYMPANRPKMSDVVTMLSCLKEVKDVGMIRESAEGHEFGSFNSHFTCGSYFGQEGNISMSTLARY